MAAPTKCASWKTGDRLCHRAKLRWLTPGPTTPLDHPDNDLKASADAWLVVARAALTDGNSVLHSVTVTFERLAPHITQGNTEPVLSHMPKAKLDRSCILH